MQSLSAVALGLSLLAAQGPAALAVRLQDASAKPILGDIHFSNLAEEEVTQPGNYELLRLPAEKNKTALINLRGNFLVPTDGACGLFMRNFTMKGAWLGSQVVHVRWLNGFEIKVSSERPARGGIWKHIQNFTSAASGIESLGETVEITKMSKGPALKFQLGPKTIQQRPVILLAQGPHDGLDVSMFNVQTFHVPDQSNLVTTDDDAGEESSLLANRRIANKHCEAKTKPEYVIYGNKHIWNLAGEGFDTNKPGDYELLRMPKDRRKPTLIDVRGSFVITNDAPCGRYIKNFTVTGEWLGGKTLHVRRSEEFEFKLSTSAPAVAGHWLPMVNITGSRGAIRNLPDTIKLTTVAAGSAFKLHIGTRHSGKRPTILVTQGPRKGLDFSMFFMKKFDAPEAASLLGASNHSGAAACKAPAPKGVNAFA